MVKCWNNQIILFLNLNFEFYYLLNWNWLVTKVIIFSDLFNLSFDLISKLNYSYLNSFVLIIHPKNYFNIKRNFINWWSTIRDN